MQQNLLGFECFLDGKCRKIAVLSHFFDEKFGGLFFFGGFARQFITKTSKNYKDYLGVCWTMGG